MTILSFGADASSKYYNTYTNTSSPLVHSDSFQRRHITMSADSVRNDNPVLGKDTISQSTTTNSQNKNLANAQNNRRMAYALKKTSAKLLPAERVADCLGKRISAEKGIGVRINKNTGKASYTNLVLCGSVWVCPCCSARILAKRGDEVEKGVETWTQAGGSVFMLTLTHSHNRLENLNKKVKLLRKALSRFFGDRAMKSIFEQFGKVGQIKALETTYSETNGWHPHHHILMFSKMSPDEFLGDTVSVTYDKNGYVQYVSLEREEKLIAKGRIDEIKQITFEEFIKNYWVKICRAVGLGAPSIKRGATIQDAGAVKTYLTKFKTAQELTNAQAKRGKGDSRNQWEILADAHEGCERSAKLWQIYAAAFKGEKQLFWSRGLKNMLLIDDVEDDEIEELAVTKEDEYVDILNLGVEDWGYVRKRNWESGLLAITEDDYANDTDNLSIFVYLVRKKREEQDAAREQEKRERIANLYPPEWFGEVPDIA